MEWFQVVINEVKRPEQTIQMTGFNKLLQIYNIKMLSS